MTLHDHRFVVRLAEAPPWGFDPEERDPFFEPEEFDPALYLYGQAEGSVSHGAGER